MNFSVGFLFCFYKIMTQQLRLNPNGIQYQDMQVGSHQLEVNPIQTSVCWNISPGEILNPSGSQESHRNPRTSHWDIRGILVKFSMEKDRLNIINTTPTCAANISILPEPSIINSRRLFKLIVFINYNALQSISKFTLLARTEPLNF